MDTSDRPTAIFCANDFIAIGVLNEALERELRVPDDVAVVGFDDIEMAAWPAFELTTVHNPLLHMARRAAALLIDLIDHPRTLAREVFPTELVLRRTHARTESRASPQGAADR